MVRENKRIARNELERHFREIEERRNETGILMEKLDEAVPGTTFELMMEQYPNPISEDEFYERIYEEAEKYGLI